MHIKHGHIETQLDNFCTVTLMLNKPNPLKKLFTKFPAFDGQNFAIPDKFKKISNFFN